MGGDRARGGGGSSAFDGGGGEAALMASLSSPVPGMRASVKNLALRQDAPVSAANAGFGAAPADTVAGEAAGGWVGTGGGVSKGEADCALRCDAHAATQGIPSLRCHTIV